MNAFRIRERPGEKTPAARAFLGVGSNINPEENVLAVVGILEATPTTTVVQSSSFYRTQALSAPGEPQNYRNRDADFLNGVLEIQTSLEPDALRQTLDGIEMVLGRVRTDDKYAPRTMDLDLLIYLPDPEMGPSPRNLTPRIPMPHNEIRTRAFVAIPLLELAPDLKLPPDGTPLLEVASVFSGPGGEAAASLNKRLRTLLSAR